MGKTTFSGPVRSLSGFNTCGFGSIVDIPNGTNSISLTCEDHGGRILTVNDASIVITLPSIIATDPGDSTDPNQTCNLGVTFRLLIATSATNVNINTDGTDKYIGALTTLVTTTASGKSWFAGGSDDAIDMDGTTKGGIVGSYVEITAFEAAKYYVAGRLLASGTIATPFATS